MELVFGWGRIEILRRVVVDIVFGSFINEYRICYVVICELRLYILVKELVIRVMSFWDIIL